jgi:hypothetical protein
VLVYPATPELAAKTMFVRQYLSTCHQDIDRNGMSPESVRQTQEGYRAWLFPQLCNHLRVTLDIFESQLGLVTPRPVA